MVDRVILLEYMDPLLRKLQMLTQICFLKTFLVFIHIVSDIEEKQHSQFSHVFSYI